MTQRVAILTVHTDPKVISNIGYRDIVKAVCTINLTMIAFTIIERTRWLRAPVYELNVKLISATSLRPYGYKMFDTYEEALEFGKNFLIERFPEATDAEAVALIS